MCPQDKYSVTLTITDGEGWGAQIDYWRNEKGGSCEWRTFDGTTASEVALFLLQALQQVAPLHHQATLHQQACYHTLIVEEAEEETCPKDNLPF